MDVLADKSLGGLASYYFVPFGSHFDLIYLMMSVFNSMTLDWYKVIFLHQKLVKIVGGISSSVMVENWKDLKDTLAVLLLRVC